MPVLSRAGCNMGACHGNLNGKGGFKLSLRGFEPAFDHSWLTSESGGRRIDRVIPSNSLLLVKATGQIAHQGGTRFQSGSFEYEMLRKWIAQGSPGIDPDEPELSSLTVTPAESIIIGDSPTEIALRATATFSDGTHRDVTSLVSYDVSDLCVEVGTDGVIRRRNFGEATLVVRYLHQQVPVRVAFVPHHDGFVWKSPPPLNYIDALVDDKLRQLQINPSELCNDSTFVRRAYLDALGILPTAVEAREFVQNARPDKRERLIDDLLQRNEFAELWALKWADVLRTEEKVLDPRGVKVFYDWIRESMLQAKPIDKFVRELVRGTGSTYENPPANFYRANRDPSTRAETTARLFMGVRLQCAKCHNHPFDRWTQDDYYSWSAVFARVDYDIKSNERKDKLDKNEFNGEQIVNVETWGAVKHPNTNAIVAPRLLGGDQLGPGSYQDRLTPLAVWLTSTENRLFARAQANFIWYHIMGRGLIEPVDDLRATNPAANEPLMEALADDFVASKFDLRHLVRRIMTSRTYQLSSEPNPTNEVDQRNFSHAVVYRLPAEKLLDAQSQVLQVPLQFIGSDPGIRAGQVAGGLKTPRRDQPLDSGDRFLKVFGKPARMLACECERSNETTLNQAFYLLSNDDFLKRLENPGSRPAELAASAMSDAEIIDELYWMSLSRPPSIEEMDAARTLLANSVSDDESSRTTQRRELIEDLTWALLNSKEFLLRY